MIKMQDDNLIIAPNKYLTSRQARLVLLIAQWIVNEREDAAKIKKMLSGQELDWDKFNKLLAYHDLSSFAHSFFKDYLHLIPGRQIEELRNYHLFMLSRLIELEKEFFKIADIFADQGVDLLPLKGTAFLIDRLYGNLSGLRPMADIDILVKKEQLPRAEKLAEASGYHKELCGLNEDYWRKRNYHLIFTKKKNQKIFSILEIHWLLDYPRENPLLPDLWKRAIRIPGLKNEVNELSAEDTLFCLALHLRRFGNTLALKTACDFARILIKYKDLDWDYILKQARSGRICASFYFRLIQMKYFFNLRVPDSILKGLSRPNYQQGLIRRFILKDTFRDPGRKISSIFLRHHFLAYDTFREPVSIIINIPQEQFAKFFELTPYGFKTLLLYRLRFLFFLYYLVKLLLNSTADKITKVLKISQR
ncbi:MAG TPA: nucleotidyltransferase family protein [Candidatus Omnitrophota bacterium]|nr:nucleotidyltransferase family protein [Candidatus Omnitrophota bacterium]